jgi:hypothetical protein
VIEAIRNIHTEGDSWKLAEALFVRIPDGLKGFQEILDQATAEGISGKLSTNTLRLYRDAAKRWPADKRVANVSFSAHREALNLPNSSIDGQAKMLQDLSKSLGSGKVTVASVRQAIRVKHPKPGAKPRAGGSAGAVQPPTPISNVLADIANGAPQLIAAITGSTPESQLDKLQAGLNKALEHVEKLRMKAARTKANATKKASAASASPAAPTSKANGETPSKAEGAPAAPAGRRRGDLRGL